MSLVLASSSPRRRAILEALGLRFRVVPSTAEEIGTEGERPDATAQRLARDKAREVASREAGFVLGADTVVVVDGEVLGKPEDPVDAARMLRLLGGRWHEVITGVAVVRGELEDAMCVTTRVRFCELSEARISRYVATGEGVDKAGAYAVQAVGAGLVTRVEGSYSNVVGLPAAETIDLLERAGAIEVWP